MSSPMTEHQAGFNESEGSPPMSETTNHTDSNQQIHEQIGALASAVDGLYDELQKLTQHKAGGRLSTVATAHLASLIADARRLLPIDSPAEQQSPAAAPDPPYARAELELWLAGHTG